MNNPINVKFQSGVRVIEIGNCTICGALKELVYYCPRCQKLACADEVCGVVIQRYSLCHAS